jgi:hypothetical protein
MYRSLILPFFVCETRSISMRSYPGPLSLPNDGSSMISHSHSTETPFLRVDPVGKDVREGTNISKNGLKIMIERETWLR